MSAIYNNYIQRSYNWFARKAFYCDRAMQYIAYSVIDPIVDEIFSFPPLLALWPKRFCVKDVVDLTISSAKTLTAMSAISLACPYLGITNFPVKLLASGLLSSYFILKGIKRVAGNILFRRRKFFENMQNINQIREERSRDSFSKPKVLICWTEPDFDALKHVHYTPAKANAQKLETSNIVNKEILEDIFSKCDVTYLMINGKQDFYRKIRKFSKNRYDAILIVGHGSDQGITIGNTGIRELDNWDISDLNNISIMRRISSMVKEKGVIGLCACETGLGEGSFADMLSKRTKRKVSAPNRSCAVMELEVNPDNGLMFYYRISGYYALTDSFCTSIYRFDDEGGREVLALTTEKVGKVRNKREVRRLE